MRIYLYYIGRSKDTHANALAEDYCGRASRFVPVEMREINPARFNIAERHSSANRIYLDPAGKQMDSPGFATLIAAAQRNARDLVFLVGAHEGLSEKQRAEADLLLSLGRMTWPHELARVLLAEQIYRGFAILRNLPYVR